eukprot:5317712-Alexandrium_andersonii.AAC.1
MGKDRKFVPLFKEGDDDSNGGEDSAMNDIPPTVEESPEDFIAGQETMDSDASDMSMESTSPEDANFLF